MLRLTQALGQTTSAGRPLPDLFLCLSRAGVRPRRGQVTMIAGPPNGGKSMLALHYVLKHKLRTLYVSADTDPFTTVLRSGAILTGDRVDDVETGMSGPGSAYYEDELGGMDNVMFSFDPSPTLDDIDLDVMAFEELWGSPPEVLVIDNLMNVVAEHESEYAGMREISKALHHIARRTEAGIFILHHTSESEGKPNFPASRKAIMGKINQLPEMILTVALDSYSGEYRIACVKNRSGKHDATGENYWTLYADPSRMALFEERQEWAIAAARGAIQ